MRRYVPYWKLFGRINDFSHSLGQFRVHILWCSELGIHLQIFQNMKISSGTIRSNTRTTNELNQGRPKSMLFLNNALFSGISI